MFLKRAVNTTMETNLIFDLHERSLVGTTSSLLPRRSASFLLILVFVLGGKMCSPGFRLPLKYRMTITKHPRLKANTMRMTLGFLILSLWERARSRTDPHRGSCEERGLCCVYFTADRSISPARWTFAAAYLPAHPGMSSLEVVAATRKKEKWAATNEPELRDREAAAEEAERAVLHTECSPSTGRSVCTRGDLCSPPADFDASGLLFLTLSPQKQRAHIALPNRGGAGRHY